MTTLNLDSDDELDFAAEYQAFQKSVTAWKERWPKHCQCCGGHGGFAHNENHGIPGPGETIFDLCGALELAETCHRCGQDGLTEDGEGPCKHCGWNFDDGVPQW